MCEEKLGPGAGRITKRNSFGPHSLLTANCMNQFLQAVTFGVEHTPSEGRQAIVAASRVVQFRGGAVVGFLDQFRFDESLDRSIQGRRPQPHISCGAIENFLHDSVTVLLSTCKRQQNVKPLGLQWNKRFGINFGHINIYIKRYLYLSIGDNFLKHVSLTDWPATEVRSVT